MAFFVFCSFVYHLAQRGNFGIFLHNRKTHHTENRVLGLMSRTCGGATGEQCAGVGCERRVQEEGDGEQ